MKGKELLRRCLVNKNNMRYQKELSACSQSYTQWVKEREAEAMAACGVCDTGMQKQTALIAQDYIILHSPDGEMAEAAELWIADRFRREPELKILYGDEDVRETATSERRAPWFKPDWSPDYLESVFYPGSLVAIRKSWLAEQEEEWKDLFAEEVTKEPSDYQRVVLDCIARAGAYEKGRGRKVVGHIPYVLFHSKSEQARDAYGKYSQVRKAELDGVGEDRRQEFMGDCAGHDQNLRIFRTEEERSAYLLSVIIPSKDNPELLMQCIRGVARAAGNCRYEVIVVDNGSGEENRKAIQNHLEEWERLAKPFAEGTGNRHANRPAEETGSRFTDQSALQRVCYHYEPMDFHFSRMCNIGAKEAEGELLLFLNDDVELAEDGTLETLCERAMRPYTGAVGLKLLYPGEQGERRIQHAGITNLPMGPVHKLQFHTDGKEYDFGWNRGARNVLAVTAACLMTERRKFEEAGGFSEELAVAFNDVDLCFTLYELGYENVCECGGYALHRESFSRGDDESPKKLERLLRERESLYSRHPSLCDKDPYYPAGLNREGLDTGIRPAYQTAGNVLQVLSRKTGYRRLEKQDLDAYREDPCLMVRVESAIVSDGVILTGWSVVLGDDNSCYEKELLLQADTGQNIYSIPLRGQYRPDLEENMADQKNVALSGFRIWIAENTLPEGRYQVGVRTRSRVARIRLLNWSNRKIDIK